MRARAGPRPGRTGADGGEAVRHRDGGLPHPRVLARFGAIEGPGGSGGGAWGLGCAQVPPLKGTNL